MTSGVGRERPERWPRFGRIAAFGLVSFAMLAPLFALVTVAAPQAEAQIPGVDDDSWQRFSLGITREIDGIAEIILRLESPEGFGAATMRFGGLDGLEPLHDATPPPGFDLVDDAVECQWTPGLLGACGPLISGAFRASVFTVDEPTGPLEILRIPVRITGDALPDRLDLEVISSADGYGTPVLAEVDPTLWPLWVDLVACAPLEVSLTPLDDEQVLWAEEATPDGQRPLSLQPSGDGVTVLRPSIDVTRIDVTLRTTDGQERGVSFPTGAACEAGSPASAAPGCFTDDCLTPPCVLDGDVVDTRMNQLDCEVVHGLLGHVRVGSDPCSWPGITCGADRRSVWKLVVRFEPGIDQDAVDRLFELRGLQELDLIGIGLREVPARLDEAPALRTLSLGENRIDHLPEALASAPALEVLSLADNDLATVPASLGRNPSLRSLNLSGNRLEAVPPQLLDSPWLSHLALSGNLLRELPTISNSWLRSLSIAGNQLTNLPGWMRGAPLTYLDVSDNRLDHLPPWLEQLSTLTHLDVSGNVGLGDTVASLTNLQVTTLGIAALGLEQLPALPVTLESLDASLNRLERVDGLDALPELWSVNLSMNELIEAPTLAPVRYLDLDLRDNRLRGDITEQVAGWIGDGTVSLNVSLNDGLGGNDCVTIGQVWLGFRYDGDLRQLECDETARVVVTGRILDQNGLPSHNAYVCIHAAEVDHPVDCMQTDVFGQFDFRLDDPANVRLEVEAPFTHLPAEDAPWWNWTRPPTKVTDWFGAPIGTTVVVLQFEPVTGADDLNVGSLPADAGLDGDAVSDMPARPTLEVDVRDQHGDPVAETEVCAMPALQPATCVETDASGLARFDFDDAINVQVRAKHPERGTGATGWLGVTAGELVTTTITLG